MRKYLLYITAAGILAFSVYFHAAGSPEFIKAGVVETIRGGGYVTVILNSSPREKTFYVIHEKKKIARMDIVRKIEDGGQMKYLGRIRMISPELKEIIRPGTAVVVFPKYKAIDKRFTRDSYKERIKYKPVIRTARDGREMVLVPEGKFVLGSAGGSPDQLPGRTVKLLAYYIDRFEVSNSDFRKFADAAGHAYPKYWKGHMKNGEFESNFFAHLPVIVTYHEAREYADWAGKRLPDEKEWEKAARGPEAAGSPSVLYTWGPDFKPGIANTAELWQKPETGGELWKLLKDRYNVDRPEKGYIPVSVYDRNAGSRYGVYNLNGNAPEWTDSWYRAYEGNYRKDKKFGTKYKVIRGGSFYWGRSEASVIDRKRGGIPNLFTDRAAGFRCVKDANRDDQI